MFELLQHLKNVRDGVFMTNKKSTIDDPSGEVQKRTRKENQRDFNNGIKSHNRKRDFLPYKVNYNNPRRLYNHDEDE